MRVRFKTLDIDGQILRVAIRPGSSDILPLLVFNGIGANLELIKPFADELEVALSVSRFGQVSQQNAG